MDSLEAEYYEQFPKDADYTNKFFMTFEEFKNSKQAPKQAEKLVELVESPKEDEEISNIVDEAIKEVKNEDKEEKEENIPDIVKASLEIVLLGKEILKNDIDYVSKYTKIAEQNISVMNSHYELNEKVDKTGLYYKGYWIAIGVVGTLIFPEILPYLEKGYSWLKELRGA